MNNSRTPLSAADTASEAAGVMIGLGVLTMALFPFALPFLLLTVAFAAPLLLLPLVAALPLAVVAGVVLAIRRIRRRLAAREPARATATRHAY
jgi:hypothetical protein